MALLAYLGAMSTLFGRKLTLWAEAKSWTRQKMTTAHVTSLQSKKVTTTRKVAGRKHAAHSWQPGLAKDMHEGEQL